MIMRKLTLISAVMFCLAGCGSTAEAFDQTTPAAKFAGNYMIAYPDGADVIVNVPVVTCDDPAVIAQVSDKDIDVTTPGGGMGVWEVRDFKGRHPWWKTDENGQLISSLVTEWKEDGKAFLMAEVNPMNGSALWDSARQWTRCE